MGGAGGAFWRVLPVGMFDLALWCVAAWAAVLALAFVLGRYGQRRHRRRLHMQARTLDALRSMTWQDFEKLTGEAFRRAGFRVQETGGGGADGGVDLLLFKAGRRYVVQCKQWRKVRIGAPVVQQMVGVGVHAKAAGVFVVTCGTFTAAARAYATGKPVKLIDGPALLRLIEKQTLPRRRERRG